jgi:hypothetical protein
MGPLEPVAGRLEHTSGCDRPRAVRWNENRKGKSSGMADGLFG